MKFNVDKTFLHVTTLVKSTDTSKTSHKHSLVCLICMIFHAFSSNSESVSVMKQPRSNQHCQRQNSYQHHRDSSNRRRSVFEDVPRSYERTNGYAISSSKPSKSKFFSLIMYFCDGNNHDLGIWLVFCTSY